MGFRIHRTVGWALTDVEHDERTGAITDERVNTGSPLLGGRGREPATLESFEAVLAEWGQLFTDPAVCRQLRPVLYMCWS